MTLTTPPGWYPDPGRPATNAGGTARPGPRTPAPQASRRYGPAAGRRRHSRPPPSPGLPRRGAGPLVAAAAVLLVAAIVAGVAPRQATQERRRRRAAPRAPGAVGRQRPGPEGQSAPSRDPHPLVDQLNGITLPIPDGWEEGDDPVTGRVTMVTKDILYCPGDQGTAAAAGSPRRRPPRPTSRPPRPSPRTTSPTPPRTPTTRTPQATASTTTTASPRTSEVKSASVSVGGSTGYLVRWRVKTGAGPGGYVESLAFPSPMANQAMVIVRLSFDAGPDGPPLALMDTITQGIAPIGGGGGGVGNSRRRTAASACLAPPSP